MSARPALWRLMVLVAALAPAPWLMAAECELHYAVTPHPNAVEMVGAERLRRIRTALDGSAPPDELLQTSMPLTRAALAAEIGSRDGVVLRDQELVTGGYRGHTSRSIVLQADVADAAGRAWLARLAALVGFIHVQEGVLLHCAVLDGEEPTAQSIEIHDAGRADFLNDADVAYFYGLLIAAAGGDSTLGFSYYADDDRYSMLALRQSPPDERALIDRVAARLGRWSEGAVALRIYERPRVVAYPSNDWRRAPHGETYLARIGDLETVEQLQALQEQSLRLVERQLGIGAGP